MTNPPPPGWPPQVATFGQHRQQAAAGGLSPCTGRHESQAQGHQSGQLGQNPLHGLATGARVGGQVGEEPVVGGGVENVKGAAWVALHTSGNGQVSNVLERVVKAVPFEFLFFAEHSKQTCLRHRAGC